jgi:alpha-1,3-rhamnosyltransferase
VPLYNHANYFPECIESVIGQTYQNIELIVIDDGSSDASLKVAEGYVDRCEKRFVRFELRSRNNKGLCATLNEALEWCSGDYFSPVASDDAWFSQKVDSQVVAFSELKKKYDIGAIFGEVVRVDQYNKNIGWHTNYDGDVVFYDFFDVYFGRAYVSAPTAMMDMRLVKDIGGYPEDVFIEDFYMWLSITSKGHLLAKQNTKVARYRVHGDNASLILNKMNGEKVKLLKQFSRSDDDFERAKKSRLGRDFLYVAINDRKQAWGMVLRREVDLFELRNFAYFLIMLFPPLGSPLFIRTLKKITGR